MEERTLYESTGFSVQGYELWLIAIRSFVFEISRSASEAVVFEDSVFRSRAVFILTAVNENIKLFLSLR